MNLAHLTDRLSQSGYIPADKQVTIENVKEILRKRFSDIDYTKAKEDVSPFIRNVNALDVWNAEIFSEITEGLNEEVEKFGLLL